MNQSILEKIQSLPENKQQEVEDFVNFLSDKYSTNDILIDSIESQRRLNAGRLSGKIKMTEDFNSIPEEFQNYI